MREQNCTVQPPKILGPINGSFPAIGTSVRRGLAWATVVGARIALNIDGSTQVRLALQWLDDGAFRTIEVSPFELDFPSAKEMIGYVIGPMDAGGA